MANIPPDVIARYVITDADTSYLLQTFDEPAGISVLEVGAHDEPVANILSECGYKVTGVDLRDYNPNQDIPNSGEKPPCNYTYIRSDFCNLPREFLHSHWGAFDTAVSLSAIEHFGLGTYSEGKPHPYYDVLAMRTIWDLLREGGTCYLSVPFGRQHLDVIPHWRVYDRNTLTSRLIQDFTIEWAIPLVAGPMELDGRTYQDGDEITMAQALRFSGTPPHVSILLKMRKIGVKRLAPDGR